MATYRSNCTQKVGKVAVVFLGEWLPNMTMEKEVPKVLLYERETETERERERERERVTLS
jgi:hypothetical protein